MIRASRVSRQLADAGHTRAGWHDDGMCPVYTPGFRVFQAGAQATVATCDGGIGLYAATLRDLGYSVVKLEHDEEHPVLLVSAKNGD